MYRIKEGNNTNKSQIKKKDRTFISVWLLPHKWKSLWAWFKLFLSCLAEVCTPGIMHRGAFMLPELRQSWCLSSCSRGPREAHRSPTFQQGLFYTWDLKTTEESVYKGTDKSVMRSCHLVSDDICHLKALGCTLLFLCGLHFVFALVVLPCSPPPLTLSISVHCWSSGRDVCAGWTLCRCVRTRR